VKIRSRERRIKRRRIGARGRRRNSRKRFPRGIPNVANCLSSGIELPSVPLSSSALFNRGINAVIMSKLFRLSLLGITSIDHVPHKSEYKENERALSCRLPSQSVPLTCVSELNAKLNTDFFQCVSLVLVITARQPMKHLDNCSFSKLEVGERRDDYR